jgi:hypothetical protein
MFKQAVSRVYKLDVGLCLLPIQVMRFKILEGGDLEALL